MHKNISKYLLVLGLMIMSFVGKSQTTDTLSDAGQREMLYRETWISDPHDRLISLKDLLKSGLIRNNKYKAAIYVRMAETIDEINSDKLNECTGHDSIDAECRKIVDEITVLYDSALKICEVCMPSHIKSRYEIEENYYVFEKQSEQDLAYLKSVGYKEFREGPTLGLNYSWCPSNQYIGMEVSPMGELNPWYRMKSLDKETGKKIVAHSNDVPTAIQTLTCGFNKNITRQGFELWFSAGQMTSPFMVNPLKFGFTENYVSDEKVHWFYRPEIGLGWGAFSVNCGYNLVFKKQFRKEDNKWFLTARFIYPIFNYY